MATLKNQQIKHFIHLYIKSNGWKKEVTFHLNKNVHFTHKQYNHGLVIVMSKKDKPTQQEKHLIMKALAESFIKDGFGFIKARDTLAKKLKYEIACRDYSNFLTTIVRMAFRQLQEFLNKHTGKQIVPITYRQEANIRLAMTQCREWMSQGDKQTFYKFISSYYQLKTVAISVQQAESLYGQLYPLIQNERFKEVIQQKKKSKDKARLENEFAKVQKAKRSKKGQRDTKENLQQMKIEEIKSNMQGKQRKLQGTSQLEYEEELDKYIKRQS